MSDNHDSLVRYQRQLEVEPDSKPLAQNYLFALQRFQIVSTPNLQALDLQSASILNWKAVLNFIEQTPENYQSHAIQAFNTLISHWPHDQRRTPYLPSADLPLSLNSLLKTNALKVVKEIDYYPTLTNRGRELEQSLLNSIKPGQITGLHYKPYGPIENTNLLAGLLDPSLDALSINLSHDSLADFIATFGVPLAESLKTLTLLSRIDQFMLHRAEINLLDIQPQPWNQLHDLTLSHEFIGYPAQSKPIALLPKLKNLTILGLYQGASQAAATGLEHLLTQCPNLGNLHFRNFEYNDPAMQMLAIKAPKAVRSLSCALRSQTSNLEELSVFSNLASLKLTNFSNSIQDQQRTSEVLQSLKSVIAANDLDIRALGLDSNSLTTLFLNSNINDWPSSLESLSFIVDNEETARLLSKLKPFKLKSLTLIIRDDETFTELAPRIAELEIDELHIKVRSVSLPTLTQGLRHFRTLKTLKIAMIPRWDRIDGEKRQAMFLDFLQQPELMQITALQTQHAPINRRHLTLLKCNPARFEDLIKYGELMKLRVN